MRDVHNENGRIHGLDSFRGIAAFAVVLNHFYNMVPELKGDSSWLFNYTPAHWLIAGRCAVIVFFVLSGFVLALPYARGAASPYRAYVIKRVCRIYLPFVVAVLGAGVLCSWLAFPRPLWVGDDPDWATVVTPALLFSHVGMQGIGMQSVSLNPPIWSLIFEMRISLLFPLLVLFARRGGWVAVVVAWIVGVACGKGFVAVDGMDNFYVGGSALGAVLVTGYYVPFFVLGAWFALHRQQVNDWFLRVPRMIHALVLMGFLFVPYALLKEHFTLTDVYYAAFAVYAIAGCQLWRTFSRLLARPVFMWLGRVSYSLYLTHLPVLLACVYGLHEMMPLPLILLVAMGFTLLVADVFYRTVERPAQMLGKRLVG